MLLWKVPRWGVTHWDAPLDSLKILKSAFIISVQITNFALFALTFLIQVTLVGLWLGEPSHLLWFQSMATAHRPLIESVLFLGTKHKGHSNMLPNSLKTFRKWVQTNKFYLRSRSHQCHAALWFSFELKCPSKGKWWDRQHCGPSPRVHRCRVQLFRRSAPLQVATSNMCNSSACSHGHCYIFHSVVQAELFSLILPAASPKSLLPLAHYFGFFVSMSE